MTNVPEQLLATNKEAFETMISFAGILYVGTEKLIDLQLKAAKAAFSDTAKHARSVAAAKDVQEFTDLQTTFVQPVADKFAAYARSVYAVTTETQTELTKFAEERVTEFNKTLASTLDKAAKNAPGGSDVAVAAVKSALAAANQAYDVFSKASRQVAEATEATISAATSTTAAKKKVA